jgi:hypothetical protein
MRDEVPAVRCCPFERVSKRRKGVFGVYTLPAVKVNWSVAELIGLVPPAVVTVICVPPGPV